MLQIRVAELAALAQLDAVSKTETFAKALSSAAVRPVKAVGQIITNPVETAKGVPGGERFFGRVKRGATNLWEAMTGSDKSSADRAGEVARRVGGISVDALGYEQEHRQLAKALKVDPYTTNPVLAAKLDEVAWVTFSAARDQYAHCGAHPWVDGDLGNDVHRRSHLGYTHHRTASVKRAEAARYGSER
jgi:hypothetical protein